MFPLVSFVIVNDMVSISNDLTGRGRLAASIGAQLRLRRTQRGLSGAELARQAGISKATLSGLEAGRANPTVETLDALAIALHIPLTDLLTHDGDSDTVLLRGTSMPNTGPARELLRRIGGGHSVELWRLRLPPNTRFDGVPHSPLSTEYLLVTAGPVTAGPTDDPATLHAGDLLVFAGNQPHHYRSATDPAEITMLITSPTPG